MRVEFANCILACSSCKESTKFQIRSDTLIILNRSYKRLRILGAVKETNVKLGAYE